MYTSLVPDGALLHDRTHPPATAPRFASVKQEWRAWLPEEKAQYFHELRSQLETSNSMLSVSLNEALELHKTGRAGTSCQAVMMTESLCERMVLPLRSLLSGLVRYAKHYGIVPKVLPLNPSNFEGQRGQRMARKNSLLNRVLLSQRSQFLHKMATLGDIVDDLGREFCESAEELSDHTALQPQLLWNTLGANHYDLTTCLSETIVLLKSFLIALPDDQLANLKQALLQSFAITKTNQSRPRVFHHRRIPQIAGE